MFNKLPLEIFYIIFDNIACRDLNNLLKVNKNFFNMTKHYIDYHKIINRVMMFDIILFKKYYHVLNGIPIVDKLSNDGFDAYNEYYILDQDCSVEVLHWLTHHYIYNNYNDLYEHDKYKDCEHNKNYFISDTYNDPLTDKNFCKLIFKCVSRIGNFENMKWLKNNCFACDGRTFEESAYNGDLNIMKWLRKNKCSYNKMTFEKAALNGNLENMKWLKYNSCRWNDSIFSYAIKNGNLENMKWLKKVGCWYQRNTFDFAVSYEHYNTLDIIQWLKDNNCRFSSQTFTSAIKIGNLKVMQWLLKNGCKFDSLSFTEAIKNGNLENMKWLKNNGCKFTCYEMNSAINTNILENILWLRDNGCTFQHTEVTCSDCK
jgi:hypothetical protein